jgi:hypothetical protein
MHPPAPALPTFGSSSLVSNLVLRGKAVHGALAIIHLTNQRSSRMSPSEIHAPTMPAATPPRPSTAAGGNEPYRHRQTLLEHVCVDRHRWKMTRAMKRS